MKTAKKPYWEMNAEELRKATRDFDRELVHDDFHPLGTAKRAVWQRLQGEGDTVLLFCVKSLRQVRTLRERGKKAGKALAHSLKDVCGEDPIEVLKDFKLLPLGRDPHDPSQKMNLAEQ